MVLKLYYDLVSPPVRAVYLIIKTLNIPVELIELRIIKGDIKREEYLKINPQGTVPCIDDDGFVLLDSHAINVYLTTKYAAGEDKLYPSDPKKCAVVNERLYFESCELFPLLKSTVRNIIIHGFLVVDADLISRFENAYEGLEIYLKKSLNIAGDDLTLADFSVVTTVTSMNVFVPIKKEKFPFLSAYLERATEWPYYEQINVPGLKKLAKLVEKSYQLKLKL